jgi:CBS domain containing-hemolysin-like protein
VTILVYLLLALLLLLLNAFFVLAEFAAVKMRPSRVEELVSQGSPKAKLVKRIQTHLDEYLSVCQVGITFASIGLGFVGEPAFARLLVNLTGLNTAAAHTVAVTAAYIVVSFLHILIGELVPKSLAIRRPEGSALLTARPLSFFRWVFYVPLVVLNGSANAILGLFGFSGAARDSDHSEEELRIILAQSQSSGLMSFRRLLILENVFDLGDVRVRDAMRPREAVKVLHAGAPWADNLKVIRESRFSRYPLLDGDPDRPAGIVNVKDLLYEGPEKMASVDLRKIARPFLTTTVDFPVEGLMSELQRHRGHLAIVRDAQGKWVGFLTLEDVVEEIIGTIEDEFEVEPPLFLSDTLTAARVVLGVSAGDVAEAVRKAIERVPPGELPVAADKVIVAVLDREKSMSTYLGSGLAIPHARLEGIEKPVLLFARSEEGVPVRGGAERAHLFFVLLTPVGSPREQVRLLAQICSLLDSAYVTDRLLRAGTPAEVLEGIRAAESHISR